MFMQYVDTLVSVKKKELTEAEAMRRYTEYKKTVEHLRTRKARRGSKRSLVLELTTARASAPAGYAQFRRRTLAVVERRMLRDLVATRAGYYREGSRKIVSR